MKNPVWYSQGLSFGCQKSGFCCTGEAGYVWVNKKEIKQLAEMVGLSITDFMMRHTRKVGEKYSLLEKNNGDCEFYKKESGCTVYQARPLQCQTYPFWPEIMESEDCWHEEEQSCQGIGKGRRFSLEEIEKRLKKQKAWRP